MLTGAKIGYMAIDFSGGPFSETLTFEVKRSTTVLASVQVKIEGYDKF